MRTSVLREVLAMVRQNPLWRYMIGAEDIISGQSDCSGFVHLALAWLGYDVPRASSLDWYHYGGSDHVTPSIVSVPGHVGVLVAADLVVDLYQSTPDKPCVRTLSLSDWVLSTGKTTPHFVSFKELSKLWGPGSSSGKAKR